MANDTQPTIERVLAISANQHAFISGVAQVNKELAILLMMVLCLGEWGAHQLLNATITIEASYDGPQIRVT